MKVLVLGGTGAMGVPLVELLNKEHNVFVTSRSVRKNYGNVRFIHGNARETSFIKNILKEHYDVIFDFSVCSTENFKERAAIFLSATEQYFFLSSSRVYANLEIPLTESSPRLLDSCRDSQYLCTDEYALAKAREENILMNSGKNNWTIIRPYITYNSERLQLGVYEKENWLNRVLDGKTVIFPKDIAEKQTSLTYGFDVSKAMVKLMGNPKAFGEIFQVATDQSIKWNEVLTIYSNILEKECGVKVKVKYVENSETLQKVWNPYQIKYDRMLNRTFDSSKLYRTVGVFSYTDVYEGLSGCLLHFLKEPNWLNKNLDYEIWSDKQAKEWTSISQIQGIKRKIYYVRQRYFQK